MNGFLIINKPSGCTSRDIVNNICKIFHTKKVGHTGTLDPLATGVLVICIGKATKLVDLLTSKNKEYIATMKCGIKTDTADITGSVIEEKPFELTEEKIKSVLSSFIGTTTQQVPAYSAVKVNGKKLYEYARANEEVPIVKRNITIEEIQLLDFKEDEITFKVSVSKGTFIRALIEDIAEKLDTVGTMTSLCRTKQGDFTLNEAMELSDINESVTLLPISKVLDEYDKEEVPLAFYTPILNGAKIPLQIKNEYLVFCEEDTPIAIYMQDESDPSMAKPYKML